MRARRRKDEERGHRRRGQVVGDGLVCVCVCEGVLCGQRGRRAREAGSGSLRAFVDLNGARHDATHLACQPACVAGAGCARILC